MTLEKIDPGAQSALRGQKSDPGAVGGQGPPGSQGSPRNEGSPGKDATKLFAYIYDEGPSSAATVQWGQGVTGVSDPEPAASPYQVTFSANLAQCAISVTAGQGVPTGPAPVRGPDPAVANVTSSGLSSTVEVSFHAGELFVDNSFFIVAFC